MRLNYPLIILVLLGGCLSSCYRKVLIIQASAEGCIIPESSFLYDSLLAVKNSLYETDTLDCAKILQNRFSLRSSNIAQDMQMIPLLCKFAKQEKNNTNPSEFLQTKVDIQQQILVSITDLNSLLSEITCERERMQELYDALNGQISKRINKATVYSIIAGGLTTIIAATIAIRGNEDVPYYEQGIGIAGAAAGTYWGFRSISQKSKIKFLHSRNHLTDIWLRQSQSHIYSPYIWNYLSKTFTLKGKTTNGLELVLNKWEELELPLAKDDRKYEQKLHLMLGMGGDYTLEDLENRIKMYEILVDEIITINYDLNRLQEEIMLGFKIH